MRVTKFIGIATIVAFTVGLSATTGANAGAPLPAVFGVPVGINDPSGDENPAKLGQGDLRSVHVATKPVLGVPSLVVSASVSTWASLTSTAWTTNDTYLDWYVDTNADGTKDFDVYLYNDFNMVHADVIRIATGKTVCHGVPTSSITAKSYAVRAPLSCFGNPRVVRAYASLRYSNGGANYAFDKAPNVNWTASLATQLWPGKPGTPVATAGHRSLDVHWTAPAASMWPVTDYVVQYSLTTSIAWKTFADGVSTVPSAHITGLTAGKPYIVRVFAKNHLGAGVASVHSAARVPLV